VAPKRITLSLEQSEPSQKRGAGWWQQTDEFSAMRRFGVKDLDIQMWRFLPFAQANSTS
jgi:hypothetical protein